VVEIEGRDGKKSKTLGVTVKLSETPGSVRTPPVDFGESTAAVLQELGYSLEEIKDFEKEDVI
jgi:crotonobetainyl-CoA:carnitine CoA-transferase CaiB-like acyl-CoA transferase